MIILTALKIIGIILLVILGLLFFLLLCILFIPIRYDIYGKAGEGYEAGFNVSYLIGLFKVHGQYDGDGFDIKLRVLWFKLFEDKKTEKTIKDGESQRAEEGPETEPENCSRQKYADPVKTEEKKDAKKDAKEPEKPKRRQKSQKDEKDNAPNTLGKLKKLLEDESDKEAISHIFNVIIKLLKRIFPDTAKGRVIFSLGSPELTGQALGILSLIPMFMDKRLHVGADFESDEVYVNGNIRIIGRIRLYIFVLAAAYIFKDSKIRRLIKHLR